MSKFKGTKGEWEVGFTSIEKKWVNVNPKHNITHLRAFYGTGITKEESEANAKLIACAPEMLNMLIRISEHEYFSGSKEIENLIKKATE